MFTTDIERCEHGGGQRVQIAFITDGTVVHKILSHLGLPTEAPPIAPARAPLQQDLDWIEATEPPTIQPRSRQTPIGHQSGKLGSPAKRPIAVQDGHFSGLDTRYWRLKDTLQKPQMMFLRENQASAPNLVDPTVAEPSAREVTRDRALDATPPRGTSAMEAMEVMDVESRA